MKLTCAWEKVGHKANKATGKADIDLTEHLKMTGQMHLPQSGIMVGCLDRLTKNDLIEEAYMRGSLGRGHGDIHSDIDMFLVVDPDNLEKTYEAVKVYLEKQGGIITSCYDRLVENGTDNYGGVGFMFVARNDKRNQIYQFDLYMAMKGVAPKNAVSIKPRIYSKDLSYKWLDEYGKKEKDVNLSESAQRFIKKHTTGHSEEDRLELILQELMLTLFVTNKHIKRGQTSRTVVDNNFIISSAVEMLQTLTGYAPTGYASSYIGNEIVDLVRDHGDEEMVQAANRLEKLFIQPVSQQKLRDALSYASFVLEKSYPQRYARLKKAIDIFQDEVLTPPSSSRRNANPKPKPSQG